MTKMASLKRVVIVLSIISLAAISGYLFYIFNHGELGDAKIYSSLQRVEYEGRRKYSQPVVLIDLGAPSGNAVGLRNHSQDSPYTWVLLNQLTSERSIVIIPPSEKLDVTCEEVNAVLRGVTVNRAVMTFLSQNCRH